MQKILQMLQLQQQLNDNTNGKEWEKGITKNGKIIDWKRCAYLECAELIESYPWKHWKSIDASPDYENIKIESVDIWHFIMSLALQEYYLGKLGDINKLAQDITNTPNYDAFCQDIKPTDKNYYEQIECIEELIKDLFCQSTTAKIIESFFEVAIQSSLNLDTLYKLYIGKNILNQFRQDHGYKQGTYIKIWNGKEDNVIMQEILDSQDDISANELYKGLQEVYQSL